MLFNRPQRPEANMIALAWCLVVAGCATKNDGMVSLFEAIRSAETDGMDQPHDAVGDGGRSIGPYQISRAYWVDSGVSGDWMRCKDRTSAEAVMLAYWKKHCPEALRREDIETLARVHNGGPTGHRKVATLPYWMMIQTRLTKVPTTPSARSVAMPSTDEARAPVSRRVERVNGIGEERGRADVKGARRRVAGGPAGFDCRGAEWISCEKR